MWELIFSRASDDVILVVCPNLAIDVTLEVDELRAGHVHRTHRSARRAGGKGVNVARAATALGERVTIIGLAGGRIGDAIRDQLVREQLPHELLAIEGESRTCTITLEPSGRATVVNEPGPCVDGRAAADLVDAFTQRLPDARAVALMGSLPPGIDPTLYRDLTHRAREAGTFCLVDASGTSLSEALTAKPSIAKPNRGEAEALLGYSLDTAATQCRGAQALRASGAGVAIITLGAEGVVGATDRGVAHYRSTPTPDMRYGNATGAGDAFAAGMLVGHVRGFAAEQSVRLAVAVATASLAEGYGRLPAKDVRSDAVVRTPAD